MGFAVEIRPACLSKETYHRMSLILPRIQFLKDVTPLPPEDRMRSINRALEAGLEAAAATPSGADELALPHALLTLGNGWQAKSPALP
jgi:hypothetical protein